MLTIDILKQQEGLNLTDEQMSAIAVLSENDEKATFSSKFSAIHNELDEITKTITGVGKNTNEKTSEYIKRMLSEQKKSLGEIDTLKAENNRLAEQIKQGGDAALKEQLSAKDATIADVRKQYNTLKAKFDESEAAHQSQLLDYRISAEIANAMSGMQFNESIGSAIIEMAKKNVIQQVKGYNPSFIDNGGKDMLIFHDSDGAELRNPEKGLSLYTTEDLLKKEFDALGLLSGGKPKGGAGGNGGGANTNIPANLSNCKSREEAIMVLSKEVEARGLRVGSVEYQNEIAKLWAENAKYFNK